MKIRVLFFGITTDLTGENQIEITIDENLSIENLKQILKDKYPSLAHMNSYSIAVNEEYANYDVFLKPNDVVAIIPPVSGG